MLRTLAFAIRFYFFSFLCGLVAIAAGIYGLSLPSLHNNDLAIQAPNYDLIWIGTIVFGAILFISALLRAKLDRLEIKQNVMSQILKD